MLFRRTFVAASLTVVALPAHAQAWPIKPIKLVVIDKWTPVVKASGAKPD